MTGSERPADDYRKSHAQKGKDYDSFIAETPLDAYMAEWEDRHLATIIPALFPNQGRRYLDFACGTGRIVSRVAPFFREALGVDISETMLDVARGKCPNVKFVPADITSDEVDLGEAFDLITAFRFFGNAQHDLRIRVLEHLNRYLVDGGYLILNSHRNPHAIKNVLHRATGGRDELDLSYGKLRHLLDEKGFQIAACYPIGFWLFRNSLAASRDLTADSGAKYEEAFQHPIFSAFSPDMIVVARKSPN